MPSVTAIRLTGAGDINGRRIVIENIHNGAACANITYARSKGQNNSCLSDRGCHRQLALHKYWCIRGAGSEGHGGWQRLILHTVCCRASQRVGYCQRELRQRAGRYQTRPEIRAISFGAGWGRGRHIHDVVVIGNNDVGENREIHVGVLVAGDRIRDAADPVRVATNVRKLPGGVPADE